MEKTYCVYKHTAPNGKVYIGITRRTPNERWGLDGKRYKNNCHFYNAIKKYGWDNIDHEILFEGLSAYQAGEKEKALIELYDSATPAHGYNNTHGGEHGKMADHVNEENRRRGKERLGDKNSFFGRKHTAESRARMRKARLSRPDRFEQSRKGGEKSAQKLSKKVIQSPQYGDKDRVYHMFRADTNSADGCICNLVWLKDYPFSCHRFSPTHYGKWL